MIVVWLHCLLLFFIHLKLKVLTRFPASNNEKYRLTNTLEISYESQLLILVAVSFVPFYIYIFPTQTKQIKNKKIRSFALLTRSRVTPTGELSTFIPFEWHAFHLFIGGEGASSVPSIFFNILYISIQWGDCNYVINVMSMNISKFLINNLHWFLIGI